LKQLRATSGLVRLRVNRKMRMSMRGFTYFAKELGEKMENFGPAAALPL